MHVFVLLTTIAADLATPSPTMTVAPDAVTPTVVGFAATGVLTIAVVLLIADMLRRIRRANYRSQIGEELDAEQQAAAAMEATNVDDQDIDPEP